VAAPRVLGRLQPLETVLCVGSGEEFEAVEGVLEAVFSSQVQRRVLSRCKGMQVLPGKIGHNIHGSDRGVCIIYDNTKSLSDADSIPSHLAPPDLNPEPLFALARLECLVLW
jgi:hypothetical protein